MRLSSLLVSASLLALMPVSAIAAPRVIASIVPVHALVASIMDGVGTPELLLKGQNSEHQASYSPQQIEALGQADLVFMVGGGLELKLDELSGSEAVNGRAFVALDEAEGLVKLPIREGGAFVKHVHHEGEDDDHDAADASGEAEGQNHEHEHEHEHEHGTAEFDPHLWLDPVNAKVMASMITATLAKADPANAARYSANQKALDGRIDDLVADLQKEMAPVKDKPFVVYHDAYQYFERRFGLEAAGSIADFAANNPSAQRLKEVRDKVKAVNAVCVFREPQFSDKAARIVIEDTNAHDGVLDPIGATLTPGKDAYEALLRALGQNLKACLSLN